MPARGGPELPYTIVAGVIPCAPGWLVASAKVHGTVFSPEDPRIFSTLVDVLDERPKFSVVALDAPIGWPEESNVGGRTCDRGARALLGRRASSVHNAPSRASVEVGVESDGDRLDAVTSELLGRYHEVAVEMAPYHQRTVYEVHPELSFYQLKGDQPLRWAKKYEAGREERRALLEARIPGIERIVDAQLDGVPASHLLDVAACLWTARRITARAGTRIPSDPEWDAQGLRMEIVR